MKSEERHELETNALAKILTESSDKMAPYVSYVIYGLLAVAAIWAVVKLSSGAVSSQEQKEWDTYAIATLPGRADTASLKTASADYGDKTVGELARMAWADSQFSAGCQTFFINKKESTDNLKLAHDTYTEVAATAKDESLKSRAQLGIAKSLEAQAKLPAAIEAYEKVTGPFSEIADNRVKRLNELNATEDAAWLETAVAANTGNFGAGGSRPDFGADPLNLPGADPAAVGPGNSEDFLEMLRKANEAAEKNPPKADATDRYNDTAPGSEPAAETPAAETPSVVAPATETPAAEAPATETPTAEAPAVETPKTPEVPAVETPETPATPSP